MPHPKPRRRRGLVLAVAALLVVTTGAVYAVLQFNAATGVTPLPIPYDTTHKRIDKIAPGTVIPADRPPDGWTVLVSKTRPKAKTGDVDKVPSFGDLSPGK